MKRTSYKAICTSGPLTVCVSEIVKMLTAVLIGDIELWMILPTI